MNEQRHILHASVLSISEYQSSNIYMTITARMCSTRPNLNDMAVTEAFIGEIVDNANKYVGLPLCADVSKMSKKDYRGLGHMQDPISGVFYTQQIGSFFSFERKEDEYGVSLIGHARVAKRNPKICEALVEMYESSSLSFSYEILAGELTVRDGITIIDTSEENTQIGVAIVTVPAYREAKALAQVAELDGERAMRRCFLNASAYLSDVSLDTVYYWVWEAMENVFADRAMDMRAERICPDCAIFYHVPSGATWKMDYIVEESGLVILDVYEVALERKREDIDVNELETTEAREGLTPELPQTSEIVAEAAPSPPQEAAQEAVTAEAEQATEPEAPQEVVAEEKTEQEKEPEIDYAALLEQANAEIAELRRFRQAHEEAALAEETARKERERNELRLFAEKKGLDVESEAVAKAIEELDSGAILAELMRLDEEADRETEQAPVNPVVSEIRAQGNRYTLLEPDTGK